MQNSLIDLLNGHVIRPFRYRYAMRYFGEDSSEIIHPQTLLNRKIDRRANVIFDIDKNAS